MKWFTGGSDRLARLSSKAAEAAAIRAHQTDPDVIALAVERVRFQVDALLWVAIVAGLGFTMVNVQEFAAEGRAPDSLGWWTAWVLDPMVSLALLAVLRAEQVTARYQVTLGWWPHITKWFTFAATYVMNTWQSFGLAGGAFSLSGVVLHSVPPLMVFAAAETGPGLRDRLTEAVRVALTEARALADAEGASRVVVAAAQVTGHERATRETVAIGAGARRESGAVVPAARRPRKAKRGKQPRRLRADFLAEARDALASEPAAFEPSPAWCRKVTGCSERLSTDLAKTLRAELAAGTTGGTAGRTDTRASTGTETRTNAGTDAGTGGDVDELEVAA